METSVVTLSYLYLSLALLINTAIGVALISDPLLMDYLLFTLAILIAVFAYGLFAHLPRASLVANPMSNGPDSIH